MDSTVGSSISLVAFNYTRKTFKLVQSSLAGATSFQTRFFQVIKSTGLEEKNETRTGER